MSALWANRRSNGDGAPTQALPSRRGEFSPGAGEDAGESRVRENRMHGSERGRWKHDLRDLRQIGGACAPAAYSTCRP